MKDRMMNLKTVIAVGVLWCWTVSQVQAQAVCLPAPRLLTTVPMGGQVGTTFDLKITGESFENTEELIFSHPGLTAVSKLNAQGLPIENEYVVTVAKDCPQGLHEARVMTRLGLSTPRIFSVGQLDEVIRTKPNTTLELAMPLQVNSICNATMTRQAIDFYTFEATSGQRIVVDCAAEGIDSKLKAVLILADASGNDLLVERRGGAIDFTVPESGKYVIKVHDLTFNGDAYHFYRLAVTEVATRESIVRLPATRTVSSFSWPPANLGTAVAIAEQEPNHEHANAQKISLPCDLTGSFFPAADVDVFEFSAKKGEVWWVEVASERLGRPTDPSIVVQHVSNSGGEEKITDLIELSDIESPIKVSSNGYSYDGPPYNAGSPDLLGKLEIKEDGVHRLQILDLFGGTRNDPQNIYRLIIRKAEPDFAVVAWALHMNLRNGDRNALSKPIALRGGATMPLEVIVVRRDGFDGEIELLMDGLPEGVTAQGMKIPAGQSRGMILVTAAESAPRGYTRARFIGRATIGDKVETRPVHMASMAWPVPDAWSAIPSPRLLNDVSVSVCGTEAAPLTITASEDKVWEVTAGEKLTIPLVHLRRSEFSGAKMSLSTLGSGFEKTPPFDVPLNEDASSAVLDLATLKTAPGEYAIAFYGSAVAKYQYNPGAVEVAELLLKQAQGSATESAEEARQLAETAKTAMDEQKPEIEKAVQAALALQNQAEAAVKAAEAQLKKATESAKPKDIVDIVVSNPIRIRVIPAEKADSK